MMERPGKRGRGEAPRGKGLSRQSAPSTEKRHRAGSAVSLFMPGRYGNSTVGYCPSSVSFRSIAAVVARSSL